MSLALLYAVACAAYVWHFASQKPLAGRVATGLLLVSVLVHTFELGMYTMELGVPPMAGRTGAISTFVWMLAVSYLSIEVSTDERGIGIFVTPLLVALQGLVAHGEMPTDVPRYFATPVRRRPRRRAVVRLRELRAGVRHRHHVRAALPRAETAHAGHVLPAAAVAAGAGPDEHARGVDRLAAADDRAGRRRPVAA